MTATATLTQADHSDMLGAIATLPDQLVAGYDRAGEAREAISRSWPAGEHHLRPSPRTLVVCGMGGSGVSADMLVAAFGDTLVPVVGVKGYDIPSWVTDEDRVVCVSYSGNTSETLSCWHQAQARSVVAAVVTTGGQLGDLAREAQVPVVQVEAGLQPRAAVGWLFGGLAGVAEALNVVEGADSVVRHAADGARTVVDQHTRVDAGAEPPALGLARQLAGSVVVVYGESGPAESIAWRWKAQINENGKLPAFANAYPELNHNEIVGWERSAEGGARWSMVELMLPGTSEAVRTRMDVTRDLVGDDLSAAVRLEPLSRDHAGAVFELVAWGDYVSVYLALLAGIDPSPVDRISALKERLAGR